MKKNIFLQVSLTICALLIVSCSDDLNQNPTDPDLFTEVDVYSSPQQALSALAKVYSGLAVTGQQGPAGQPDIDGSIIDEGFSSFTRRKILFEVLFIVASENSIEQINNLK